MLIIIDKRSPLQAKKRLAEFGKVIEFETRNITYNAISGHPDIFICQNKESLICAPNIPKKYLQLFDSENIKFDLGKAPVGKKFPKSVLYNCLIDDNFLFHKSNYTDELILDKNRFLKFIDLPQSYTRCNLFAIAPKKYITSDKGIETTLKKINLDISYFSGKNIVLPGIKNGFIGGCMGYNNGKLFVIGNPDYHVWGADFKALLKKENTELISLYEGPFFDGGGIFFLK